MAADEEVVGDNIDDDRLQQIRHQQDLLEVQEENHRKALQEVEHNERVNSEWWRWFQGIYANADKDLVKATNAIQEIKGRIAALKQESDQRAQEIAAAPAVQDDEEDAVTSAKDVFDQNSDEVFEEATEYVSPSDSLFEEMDPIIEILGNRIEAFISDEVLVDDEVEGPAERIYAIELHYSEATKLLQQLTEQRNSTVLTAEEEVKLGRRIDVVKAQLTNQLSKIAAYRDDLSDLVTEQSQYVFEIEDLEIEDLDNQDAGEVNAAVEKFRIAAEKMEAAFNLIKAIALRPDASAEDQELLQKVQQVRDKAHAAFASVAVDCYTQQVRTILNEIDLGSSATAPNAVEKLKDMADILEEAEKALNKATVAINALPDDGPEGKKSKLMKLEVEATTAFDAMEDKVKTFARAIPEHTGADSELTAPPATPQVRPVANLLIKRNGALDDFTDTVVRSGPPDSDAAPTSSAAATPRTNIGYTESSNVYYEGVKLNKGDYVESVAHFDGGRKAVLQQDHTGRVTDASPGALSPAEQGLKAMRMAEMLISNYTPNKGDIIIRGRDPVMANRVYAALLLLKESDPHLKGAKIKSFVAGCEGPGTFTTNNSFIEKHLGGVAKPLRAEAVGEMATSTPS